MTGYWSICCRSQRQGPSVGEAGNRLVANSLPYRNHHNNGGSYQSQQYQGVSANGGGPGLLSGPSHQHMPQGRGRYEQGYTSNLQYNGSGGPSHRNSHYAPRPGPYSGGQQSPSSHYQRPQFPVAEYYSSQSHQSYSARGGPPIVGGPGSMATIQQGGYSPRAPPHSSHVAPPPVAMSAWAAGGRGPVGHPGPPVQAGYVGRVQHVVSTANSFSILDSRGRGSQGRGRGGNSYNQNRY